MPIPISNNFSHAVSHVVQHIENPNRALRVLIEEIPSDIGRTYQSYKRGGFLQWFFAFTIVSHFNHVADCALLSGISAEDVQL